MKNCFILLLLFISNNAFSQTYEIRATNKGSGVIGVEFRIVSGTPPTTSNLITDIKFGIKWLSSYNINLSSITSSYNITKSGPETINGIYEFQAFYASSTPFIIPTNWPLNTWVEVLAIPNSLSGSVSLGTFEICEVGFHTTTSPANIGIDLMDYTNPTKLTINGSTTNVILPIDIISFQAQAQNATTRLTWETSLENNADYFEVEHSANGKDFVGISKIAAQGKASRYDYTDPTPQYGIAYYRLKMVDKNGTFKYSKVLSLDFAKPSDVVKVYPNPFTDHITLNLPSEKKGDIKLIDAQGRLIWSKSSQYTEGASRQITISTVGISQGVYWLWIGNESPLKVVKL